MSVATQAPAVPQQATSLPGRQSIVLYGIDWESYEKFLEAVGERRIFLTYDRGKLEIMAPLWNHEWWKRRVGYLLPVLGHELKIKVQGGGSTTFRRRDLERGLEPDECFYIQHAVQMAGQRQLDLARDPPPDLALEIEITTSALDRMGIYAALGVPEVWRYDGNVLHVHQLQPDGEYAERSTSANFPTLPLAAFVDFLNQTQNVTDDEILEVFRDWVQKNVPLSVPETGNGS